MVTTVGRPRQTELELPMIRINGKSSLYFFVFLLHFPPAPAYETNYE